MCLRKFTAYISIVVYKCAFFVFAKIFGCEDRFLASDVGVGSTRPAGALAYPPPVSIILQTLADTGLLHVRYFTVADTRPFITSCYHKTAPQYNCQAYYNNRKLFCRRERVARFNPNISSQHRTYPHSIMNISP